jgi:type II secretory pathway component PulK
VLSIIVLLSTMAYAFHDLVASNLAIARKDVDRFRALQLARAGLNLALTLVKLDPQFGSGAYTFLPDPAYQARQAQAGADLNKLEQVYMMLRASEESGMPLENGSVAVIIRDEAARLNLNACATLPEGAGYLQNLLRICNVRKRKKLIFSNTTAADDVSQQLTNSIFDWIDVDSNARSEGAESSWYGSQTPRYRPRNGFLESIDELLLVRHMDRSIMEGVQGDDGDPGSLGIREFLTVYGANPAVNVNSAAPVVLKAIPGIFESQNRETIVAKLIANRPIRDAGTLNALLAETDSAAQARASRFMTLRSNMLRLKVTAHLGSYDGLVETVIVREAAGFIRTLYWKEQ